MVCAVPKLSPWGNRKDQDRETGSGALKAAGCWEEAERGSRRLHCPWVPENHPQGCGSVRREVPLLDPCSRRVVGPQAVQSSLILETQI